MTADELEAQLKNSNFTTYVYVGQESDRGWRVATTAAGLQAALLVFRAMNLTQVERWTGTATQVKGIVFGWSDKVVKLLNEEQADDLMEVLNANEEAAKVSTPS